MGKHSRFDVFFEKHIGLGIRWDRWTYELVVSVAMPFFTVNIGLGKKLI